MQDPGGEQRRHLFVEGRARGHKFTPPRGGGREFTTPQRDRVSHAERLIRQLALIRQKGAAVAEHVLVPGDSGGGGQGAAARRRVELDETIGPDSWRSTNLISPKRAFRFVIYDYNN